MMANFWSTSDPSLKKATRDRTFSHLVQKNFTPNFTFSQNKIFLYLSKCAKNKATIVASIHTSISINWIGTLFHLRYLVSHSFSHTLGRWKNRSLPRLRSRTKLSYDQTQSSAHPCVPRPKLQGLFGSSSAQRSGPWSGDGLIRGRFGLKSLIIGGFERTWVWSGATSSAIGSDHNLFERTFVWSEATSSAIGSDYNLFERTFVWSEATSSAIGCDHNLIERTWVWSEMVWTQLGPIRDHFERIFFHCFCFFIKWEMLALPGGSHKAAFWSVTHLKSDSSDQKTGVQPITEAGLLQKKLWSAGDHDVSYGKLSKLIHWVRNIH